MELYFVFIAIGAALFLIGLVALMWSVRSGQFDDLDTPALRMLLESKPHQPVNRSASEVVQGIDHPPAPPQPSLPPSSTSFSQSSVGSTL